MGKVQCRTVLLLLSFFFFFPPLRHQVYYIEGEIESNINIGFRAKSFLVHISAAAAAAAASTFLARGYLLSTLNRVMRKKML